MVTKEDRLKELREELREKRERYEMIVDALASGRVASQEAREVLYERMLDLEWEMFKLEDEIIELEEGGEIYE